MLVPCMLSHTQIISIKVLTKWFFISVSWKEYTGVFSGEREWNLVRIQNKLACSFWVL